MIPTVTLPGTNLTTSAIGFGCNALLGPRSRSQGLALLAAAHDAGVRHFDVARAYSSGDAEGLLGEFLVGRREGVTVTTKFGLQPSGRGLGRMKWLKSLARRLMRLSPRVRQALAARARNMTETGAFSVDQARASLEISLRELKSDHVDLLLLHEASAADCTLELKGFLDDMVRAGTMRFYGVGSGFDRVREIASERPDFARIFQFENSAVCRNREILNPAPTVATITHGAIGGSFTQLQTFLQDRPEVSRRWSEDLGLDLTDRGTLAALMLSYARHVNSAGIVLFSSTRPQAIHDNVQAVAEGRFATDQLDRFGVLAREVPYP